MQWQLSPSVIAEAATAFGLLVFAIFFPWRDLNRKASLIGPILLLVAALWLLSHSLEIGTQEVSRKTILMGLQLIWGLIALTLWLMYIVHYVASGKWQARRFYFLLGIVPLLAILAVATNDIHGLMWISPGLNAQDPYLPLEPSYGLAYWVCMAYSGALIIFGGFLILNKVVRRNNFRTWEPWVLIFAVVLPLGAAFFEVAGLTLPAGLPIGITPFFSCVGSIALVWSLPRFHLRTIIPVARNTIFQHIGDGVVVLNMQNLVVDLNPAAEHLSGYASSEALGLPVEQIWTNWPTQAVLSEPASTIIEGCVLICAAQQRTFDLHIHTIDDDKNHPLNKVVLLIDISGRKQAEEEKAKLEEQLLQAQKLETVGRLAGGVAHDFNNQLQVISSYAEMSLSMVDAKQPLHKYLLEIRRAAQRSAEITQQLLAFARKQTVSPKVMDLNDAVARSRKMLQRLIGEDIDLAWMPGSDLWKVMIDPSQLDQILANLAVNARDAIGGVGKLTVETENVAFDEAYCADHAGFVVGEYLLLALSDDGRGMDKETQSHIFEPFFTTKDPGKGTGLGLATVYGIVKQNNGFINVYSEPGHGSTFRVYFPRAEAVEKVEGEEVEEVTPRGGAETVLVVEDDGAILELAREMLGQLGYTVLSAASPEEALRVSAEHSGRIHLLLTDVVMPQMNGRQVAERLQVARSDLRCLYMSGYTADVIAHRGVLEEGVSFIAKPFSLATLAGKVRAVLDTPKGK